MISRELFVRVDLRHQTLLEMDDAISPVYLLLEQEIELEKKIIQTIQRPGFSATDFTKSPQYCQWRQSEDSQTDGPNDRNLTK
jgi:hypothetical protein